MTTENTEKTKALAKPRAEIIEYNAEKDVVFVGPSRIPIPVNLAMMELERQRLVAENDNLIEKQLALWKGREGRRPTAKQREEFKYLVQWDRKRPPRELEKFLDQVATGMKIEKIPAQYWTVIVSQDGRARVAPDSHGRFRQAQLDPKIMIGVPEEKFTHLPTNDEPYVEAEVTLKFYAGGAIYTGKQLKWIPWAADETRKQNLCNICLTQARGKAARNAVPSMFAEIAEEALEFEAGSAAPVRKPAEPSDIRHLGDLISAIYNSKLEDPETEGELLFNKRNRIAALVEVEKLEEIGTPNRPSFADAWKLLKEKCENKPKT